MLRLRVNSGALWLTERSENRAPSALEPIHLWTSGLDRSYRYVFLLRFQRRERGVSFQLTILKVLAGHPDGRASLADLRRAVAILMSSGPDWTERMKRLALRVIRS